MIVAGKVVAYDNSSAAYSRMVVAIGMSSKLSASVLLQFQLVVDPTNTAFYITTLELLHKLRSTLTEYTRVQQGPFWN